MEILSSLYFKYGGHYAIGFMAWLPIVTFVMVKVYFQEGFEGTNVLIPFIGTGAFLWSFIFGITSLPTLVCLWCFTSGAFGILSGLGFVWYVATGFLKA